MIWYVISCIWYIMPAYFGNMAPVFAKKALRGRFSTPIDFGREYRGRRITGNNKTFRGFLSAIIISIIIVVLQRQIYLSGSLVSISLLDYSNINFLWFGFLMGFGAMTGDLFKSVIKRRIDKRSGESWKPFDQIDFVVGAILITSIIYVPPISIVIGMMIFVPITKIVVDNVGVQLRIYDQRW